MQPGDVPAVAALYMRVLRRRAGAPSPGLTRFFRSFYCDGPFREPDIPSLVHVDADGRVTGFVGVNATPMLWKGRRLRAAFSGSLMVDNPRTAPLAGAALLKAFLAGAQDLSFSETANPVSQGMWERLRGHVLASSSLDWLRILRPAGFALASAAGRVPALRAALPLARAVDRLAGRRTPKSSVARFVSDANPAGLTADPVGEDEFTALLERFTEPYALRPDWSGGYGAHVLAEALSKPGFGAPVMAAVRARGGATLGAFLYHVKPGGLGRAVQVLAAPERTGAVLQCLFADALDRGAVAVRGRADARIVQAAPGRSLVFASVSSTVAHARDAELLAALQAGQGLVNGLAGETWCRLFGGALD
jgi:hypothetical protein